VILAKRLQQSIFQHALAANRFGGASGAGSGLIGAITYLGIASDQNAADTVTSTSYVVPGSATVLTFILPRTAYVLYSMRSISKTAGGAGTFAYVSAFVDGVIDATAQICDKGGTGLTTGSITTLATLAPLQAGSHTLDFRVYVDAGQTWTNAATELQGFMIAT